MTTRLGAILAVFAITTGLAGSGVASDSEVKIWVQEDTIPTYPIGDPELNPMFFSGRAYQGAKGRVYPYPLLEKLSSEKVDRKHTVVYLENEYVKVGVMPGPGGGGRLHFARTRRMGTISFTTTMSLSQG
jgi:hypothetical protein